MYPQTKRQKKQRAVYKYPKDLFKLEEEENTSTSSPNGNYDWDHLNLRQIASSVRSLLNVPRKKKYDWNLFIRIFFLLLLLRGFFDVVLIYLDSECPLLRS
ncbi:hypothetical protein JTE90_008697 [Oedothorax gibbosus]|uniref:Uncharacterized protein n=1 Tax=Oedothorax gibbosus TaxID=931172 RepID=A0AAV6V2S3_9ARAC|nr:hypothetical protein JTE90_008697 [Oedothorax gibbosus]